MENAAILNQEEFEQFNLSQELLSNINNNFIIIYQELEKPLKIESFHYINLMYDKLLKLLGNSDYGFTYDFINLDTLEIKYNREHFALLKIINRELKITKVWEHIQAATLFNESWPHWHWKSKLLEKWNGQGPVPGIRKTRGGGGYFRHPKTKKSLKQRYEFNEEKNCWEKFDIGYIPNSWDDIKRVQQKCWKKQRKVRKSWSD